MLFLLSSLALFCFNYVTSFLCGSFVHSAYFSIGENSDSQRSPIPTQNRVALWPMTSSAAFSQGERHRWGWGRGGEGGGEKTRRKKRARDTAEERDPLLKETLSKRGITRPRETEEQRKHYNLLIINS